MTITELKEQIDEDILSDLIQYCELNNIPFNVINKMLKDSLTVMKYGDKPPMFIKHDVKKENKEEKVIETPEIVEVPEEANEVEEVKVEREIVLVDTPLEIPDVLPVFEDVEISKKKKRRLNAK